MIKKEMIGSKKLLLDSSPIIPALPRIEDKSKIDVRYSLIAPYANAYIHWNPEISEVIYDVEEPILNKEEEHQLEILREAMIVVINLNPKLNKYGDLYSVGIR